MKKGFTLIELLVVITILAVLAGAALPYVQSYVEESRIAKAKTDLEEIARALAVYETREGDYPDTGIDSVDGLSDVSQLTGRYLNKSPIDPWGAQYVVDLNAGTVYSTGPDRSDVGDGKYDNISVPYQPPLALVSVKWVDKNQSGAIDFQNVNDELQLSFSRKLELGLTTADMAQYATKILLRTTSTALLDTIVSTADAILVGEKVVVYKIGVQDAFVAGRDSLEVLSAHGIIKDRATPDANLCIAGQAVKILPQ
ncbi:MAG: ral secretion pathway protein [Clostridiales bacterium]|nr:ral secretion pathway protein [Clostridiales bacterium]MDN5282966.1 ral secretion pathway protein [Candidatus Ozemobacter sp.]